MTRRGERPSFVRAPADFTVAPAPADLQDRRVEITGPVERKMMINALNSGAKVFMADFEDANSPTWDNVRRRPAQRARRGAPHDRARHGREELPPERRDRDARDPPARLAPGRAPPPGRRCADQRVALRLRARRLQQRARAARARDRPVLLSPEARVASRGAALGAGIRARRGRARAAARLDQVHRPDRDDPRRVRDGRDPLRAARPLVRAERGPLGLHLQLHQEDGCACCPTARR